MPQTPSRSARRKAEEDPFIDSRVSARRTRINQTPTSARYMSFPSHDIENHNNSGDIRDLEEEAVGGGEMGFLVAGHMTTELRRLGALMAEKDVALKELQEKVRVQGEEEEGLRKRLEMSNGNQGELRDKEARIDMVLIEKTTRQNARRSVSGSWRWLSRRFAPRSRLLKPRSKSRKMSSRRRPRNGTRRGVKPRRTSPRRID